VVVFGKARLISDPESKQEAFRALLDHMLQGRWEYSRQPDQKEIAATTVIKVPINEASVKVRSGPPQDAAKDLELGFWTGVIPLQLTAAAEIPDPVMKEERSVPPYVSDYKRGR
jgi:hypothetical protein